MTDKEQPTRPESVRLAVATWLTLIVAELIHQITQISMAVIDPSELRAAARESAENSGTQVGDGFISLMAYGSIALMGLLSLAIMVILAVALWVYATPKRYADMARRLLMVFSLYFALRGLLIFVAVPTGGSSVPTWLVLVDGSLQLIVAVSGILGLVFSGRKDALGYLGVNNTEPKN